ncbi:MAG: trypsin-like peptidase domain-containing protein [Bacteriovoracaceae bacterium]|nr:trypsin-like peptidase domain-containing protein [Bacteriovoracaceae bacterium]
MQTLLGTFLFFICFVTQANENPYQLGSAWSKLPITHETLNSLPENLRTSSLSTAKFLGGTSFYLGKFDGRHVMATNYHVLPSPLNCYGLNRAHFPIFNKSFSCKNFIAGIPQIDMTLFEIRVPQKDEQDLETLTFKFGDDTKESALYGLGFGGWGNPKRQLLLSHDKNCKFFSKEIREMSDPDTINPVDYKVWSKAIGCDFSHGDSGAPIFNVEGEFLGIFWTGSAPKPQYLKNDAYLDQIMKDGSEVIWTELSYMSPASKIKESFQSLIESDHPAKRILEKILLID